MLWELYQQSRIGAARSEAEYASRNSSEAHRMLRQLESRTDRLSLTTMAIWQIMSDKLGVTEADLEAQIREIDLSDGKLDGKVRVEVTDCRNCGRPLSKRHVKCMYCGSNTDQGLTGL